MEVPKKLNIFGKSYRVKVAQLEGHLAGICDKAGGLILIQKGMTPEETLHTLIHEIGHAVSYRTSIDQSLDWQTEEHFVNNLATALVENGLVK